MKKLIKWLIAILVIAVIGVCGYFGYQFFNASQQSASLDELQTVTVERGALSAVIGATGTVRSRQSSNVSWQTSGTVSVVNVQLGDTVKEDAVLAELDPTNWPQSLLSAQAELIQAQNNLDELLDPDAIAIAQAEASLAQAQKQLDNLRNPTELAIAQAQKAIVTAQEAVDDAQYDVDVLGYTRGSTQDIEAARANYLLAQENVERMQKIYGDTPGDPGEDARKALALSNLAAAETQRDRALGVLNWYLGTPTEDEILEANTNLALAQAQLLDAQQRLEALNSPDEVDMMTAEAKVLDAQDKLDTLKNGASEDDIAVAQNRVTMAQATLNQANLAAPFPGTITQIEVMRGDVASPGKAAFRLDDLSAMFIDLEVSEVDIYLIHTGQPVSITFDAIPDRGYAGVVTEIGQVGVLSQGAVSFQVTVQLTSPDSDVKPGMTAVANIVVAQVENALMIPNRAVQFADGNRFVYLWDDSGLHEVTVKLGLSSDTMSELITDELKEGDVIVINPPADFSMMGGGPFGGMRRALP